MLPAYWQNGALCSTVVKVPGSFWERHHGDWIICHKSGPSSHSLVEISRKHCVVFRNYTRTLPCANFYGNLFCDNIVIFIIAMSLSVCWTRRQGFTTASCREFIAPIRAVSFAITQPAFWNTGIWPRATEQPWSTCHWAWEKNRTTCSTFKSQRNQWFECGKVKK